MPIIFKSGGKTLDVEDLPLDAYIDIEAQTKVAWHTLLANPYRHAAAAQALATACAKHLGVDVPKLTPRTLLEVFEVTTEPNVPEQFTDGAPDPKAEASESSTT